MGKNVKRLLDQFAPSHYNLQLELDPDKLLFNGKVTVEGKKVGRPSQRITFHQKDLKFSSAKIIKHDKKQDLEITVSRINAQKTYEEVRLHSDEMIYPGAYSVELSFSGKITKNMTGLYPCHFEHEGKQKKLLATQFESHHAREVFPSIDEPAAKATFDLSLTTPTGIQVLSNMPAKSQENIAKKLITTFETSPIMSSYLLAFVVGEMHCIEAKSKNEITMRTWGHKGQPKKFLEYANKEAIDVIDFFEKYFDTPFPLKKCDQVALPDFESGAMENWGLITYREVALLTDLDNPSISSEQYISMVIAHELSHQWFGNLVTMQWWDDLWLNESFASLMEHVALDRLHPDWHQWEHYASTDIIACSNRDIYKDVQPVRVKVQHPDEIHTLFDPAIVYAKGGRLLKMLMDYIGEDTFRRGLKIYFDEHKYKNTTRDDLWSALSISSGKDINSFMNPWLEQSGLPLVSVSIASSALRLKQKRFLLDGEDKDSIWPIPLLTNQPVDPEILENRNSLVSFEGETPLLNVNGSGHYLIKYNDDTQQKALADAFQTQSIPAPARISLINDMLLLSRRGDYSITEVLDVIKGCSEEPREAVWSLIGHALGLSMMLSEGEKSLESALREMKVDLASHWYKKLGWVANSPNREDDPNTKLLRTTAVGMMVGGEDKGAIAKAIDLYSKNKLEDLPSEKRGIIIGAKVRHDASSKVIGELIEKFKTTQNPDLQLSIASALTHTKDDKVVTKLLSDGMGEDGFVRNQDIFRWFALLMRNQYAREQTWEWLNSSWERLEKDFGGGKSLDHFIVYAAGPLHTKVWQKKFSEFFNPKLNQISLARNIKIAQSEIEARAAWHTRDLPNLKKYLG